MMTLREVQVKLGSASVTNVAVANKAGVKQAMLFLEDRNGRLIRALVPWEAIEEAVLNTVPGEPVHPAPAVTQRHIKAA